MHYLSKSFSKTGLRALRLQRRLIFNFGDLKLHDLAELCFYKLIMTKSNFLWNC